MIIHRQPTLVMHSKHRLCGHDRAEVRSKPNPKNLIRTFNHTLKALKPRTCAEHFLENQATSILCYTILFYSILYYTILYSILFYTLRLLYYTILCHSRRRNSARLSRAPPQSSPARQGKRAGRQDREPNRPAQVPKDAIFRRFWGLAI